MPRQRKWNPEDLQQQAPCDFESGQIANEYYAKVADRGIADSEVARVLKSRASGVWR